MYTAHTLVAPDELLEEVRCVKAEYTEECQWGSSIWSNERTIAAPDVEV